MAYDSESDRVILFGGRGPSVGRETWAFDVNTNTWTRMSATGPSARFGTAMVYVPGLDRVILFGGFESSTGNPSDETWAYNLNGDAWTLLPATNSPSPRGIPALAYDVASGQVILFGGNTGVVPNDETWSFDPQTLAWTQQSPTLRPSPRERYDTVYVPTLDRVVLFGGGTTGSLSNETWTYDFDNDAWTEMNPASAPSRRWGHRMVYDTKADRVILFAGDSNARNNETWAYLSTNEWTKLNPPLPPTGRTVHRMAYDIESDRVIIFGGEWPFSGVANDETWAYDSGANEWIPLTSPAHPAARSYHSVAYDAESDRVVLFSGIVEFGTTVDTLDNATWRYDLNTNTWTEANPNPWPPPLAGHTMAYDSKSDRVVLTGGCTSCPPSPFVGNPDTWAYDVDANLWSKMPTGVHPPGMIGGRVAYDAESDRVVLFGGLSSSLTFLDATWAYDFDTNTWIEMNPTPRPQARNYAGMTYDAESDRVILFGGSPTLTGPDLGDTWSYDFNTNTWTNMQPTAAPSAREYQGMVYDSQSDRVILFGGNPGETETWAYDFNSNTWTNMNPPSAPQGRSRHGMAYDSESDRTILFAGWRPPYAAQNVELLSDTWSYDFESNAWMPKLVAPSAPQSLQATLSAGRVDVAWSPPSLEGSHAVVDYRVYRGIGSAAPTLLAEVGNVLSYPDTNVIEGTTYAYEVAALNAAGESPRSKRAAATVPDVTNPSIAISSPAAGAVLASQAVTVTGTATDNAALDKVELSSDGTNWIPATGTTSWSGVLSFTDGSQTIRARATDTFGNEAIASRDLVIDTATPVVTIVSPPDGATLTSTAVSVSGTASDNWALGSVELSTDGATWVPATGTTSWSGTVVLREGSNKIHARATDAAGNDATSSVTVTVAPGPSPLLIGGVAAGVAGVAAAAVLLFRRRKRGS